MLNELYQSLDPVAFSAGPITIYWYGISYIVGALLTGVVMYRTQRRWGLDITVDDIMTVVVGIVFGLLIGARLFYVLFYGDGYYFAHPLEIFAVNHGGMSFHGGLVGGALGGILACLVEDLSGLVIIACIHVCLRQEQVGRDGLLVLIDGGIQRHHRIRGIAVREVQHGLQILEEAIRFRI